MIERASESRMAEDHVSPSHAAAYGPMSERR
jgi:hypothetical protein